MVRLADDIRKVSLLEGAYLHDRPPAGLSSIRTSLRRCLAKIEINSSAPLDDIDVLGTIIQLMSLPAIHARREELVEVEKKVLPQRGFGIEEFGLSTCWFKRQYADFHLVMVLDLPVAETFVKKVSLHDTLEPPTQGGFSAAADDRQ
ncbi:hypothetical protein QFC21_007131 [Naganishia friedmannii]|uniref:Uncharacterized protein n=1 Tax=Naganishia friedmannii TaxID=89922 RepID=A0ACC2UY51_9TREE|nr:hypothetical protein QFC21_007131 [Naganishia friedmannii]